MEHNIQIQDNSNDRKPSILQRLLWWCAGADKGILIKCPHEWAKYASMGATILFTGILAAIAGGYALHTIFRNGPDDSVKWYVIAFGVLWGMIIFNLDRYIITSFKKSSSESRFARLRSDTLHALPRIILAIIIAITISKPIEIRMFEDRLEQQILENKKVKLASNAEDYSNIYSLDSKQADVNNKKSRVDQLVADSQKDPQYVIDLIAEKKELESKLQKEENEVRNYSSNISLILSNNSNYDCPKDSLKTDKEKVQHLLSTPRQKYETNYRSRAEHISKRNNLRKNISDIENDIKAKRENYKHLMDSTILVANSEYSSSVDTLKNARKNAENETQKADRIADKAYKSNFVTQLEALGDLKNAQIKESDSEYVKREKEDNAHTFSLISWALTLLFLCIELAPMLTKLIIKRGAYDDYLDAADHIANKKAEEEKMQYDAIIKISSKQCEAECNANIAANEELMEKIARAQVELLDVAIIEWKEEELAKIRANPSDYIRNNTNHPAQ